MSKETIPMTAARKGLTITWFAGAAPFLGVLIVQSLLAKYDDPQKAWSWALPNITPTLLLIIAVLVAETNENLAKAKAGRFLYRLTLGLSIFYLIALNLVIFLAPFSTKPPLEIMQDSNIFLGPLQGVVGGAFGAFFIARKE